jgi:hypothetical protein
MARPSIDKSDNRRSLATLVKKEATATEINVVKSAVEIIKEGFMTKVTKRRMN